MPSTPEVEAALRERFGFGGFRAGQRELIGAALAGPDALGILPTGGGKSLTYQLPATLRDGLTVVVSPLIALMKDQVDAFNRRGLGRAVAIHSDLTPREAGAALEQARSGTARLLYLQRLLRRMPEGRLGPEALASLAEGLTEEQRNVAIVALVDEGVLARDRDGGLRRVEHVGPRRRLSLASMEARRKADYARLEAIVAYCRDRRCQRRRLLEYFGEAQPTKYRCHNCSACRRRTSRPRPEFIEGSGRPPSFPDGRRAPGGPGRSSKPDALTSSERAGESSADPATGNFEVVRDAWPWLTQDGPVTPRSLARFLRGLRTARAPAAWPDLAGFGLFSGLTRRESEHLAAEVLDRLRPGEPIFSDLAFMLI